MSSYDIDDIIRAQLWLEKNSPLYLAAMNKGDVKIMTVIIKDYLEGESE